MDSVPSTHLSSIQLIYDKRAATYDAEGGFHTSQHADYIQVMALKPGFSVIDLACGTAAIAIAAKRAVGPSGHVVGVDISAASLSIAKAKAKNEALDITFIQHDIGALNGVYGVGEGAFDVATCASALVLLENPASAVKCWAKLLKPGGRLIFDVPTNNNAIGGYVLDKVGKQLHVPAIYDRTNFDSAEKVQKLLTDAGLDSRESFLSKTYASEYLDAENAEGIYDSMVQQKTLETWHVGLNDPTVRKVSKELFCKIFREMADADGKVLQQLRFHMAVGKKI